jgi:hypothetical protein
MSAVRCLCRQTPPWIVAGVLILLPARADAHRLDEYLQATRVAVDVDLVRLEIDLSPGVDVADGIIGAIDSDHDGRIDTNEAQSYAAAVLGAVTVSLDGRPVSLRLDARAFPAVDDMRQGVGTIRITASASAPATTGSHRLALENAWMPAISVYLVNALVPTDPRITVDAQHRDQFQRTYTLDYDVAGRRAWIGWAGVALAMIVLLLTGRRKPVRP